MIATIFSGWFLFMIGATISLRIWGTIKENKEQQEFIKKLDDQNNIK